MLNPTGLACHTVGSALALYQGASEKDAQTLRSIAKKLFPEALDMSQGAYHLFLNQLPLEELKKTVAPAGTGWAPETAAALRATCPENDTYFKAYPRAVKRFLEFASDAGLITVEKAPEFLPEWETMLAKARLAMPQTKAQLVALAMAGTTTIIGKHRINLEDLDATDKQMQGIRSSMSGLARKASAAGLTPKAFAEEVLDGPRGKELATLAGANIYCSYARGLWNYTVTQNPDLDLPLWPDRRRFVGKPMDDWAAPLRDGVNAGLLKRPGSKLAESSEKNYRDSMCQYVGLLESGGFDLDPILEELTPRDAVRLVCQGWPRELLAGDPERDAPLAIYRKLLGEPSYRDRVLEQMKAQDGRPLERMLDENPFVAVALAARIENETFSAAHAMLCRIYNINVEYLAQGDGNVKWLTVRLDEVEALDDERETPYNEKKQVVFAAPCLFERLVAREASLFAGLEQRFSTHGKAWAVYVRNLAMCTVKTFFPLRVRNHQLMKIGTTGNNCYDPTRHVLMVKKSDVKNRKRLEFELPEAGAQAWVRDLMDLYIHRARPVLLAGADSEYLWVADHQAPNAKGFLQRQRFNEILIKFGGDNFGDSLPSSLGHLNPHLFRHIAATYQIVMCKDPNMAARLLNDTLKTIYDHYADILGSSRQTCKDFYEGFDPRP